MSSWSDLIRVRRTLNSAMPTEAIAPINAPKRRSVGLASVAPIPAPRTATTICKRGSTNTPLVAIGSQTRDTSSCDRCREACTKTNHGCVYRGAGTIRNRIETYHQEHDRVLREVLYGDGIAGADAAMPSIL